MGRLALGREAAIYRAALPPVGQAESRRVIPLEPDELWDAIALQIRNNELLQRLEEASLPRAVGIRNELRRNRQRLGLLLERMNLESSTFDQVVVDTPAIVEGVKLARMDLEEAADAMALSNPDDLVVSIQGRGFPFMDGFWMRADYVDAAGGLRMIPMTQTAQSSDLTTLEYSAGAPLSAFQLAVGSTVTLTMVCDMKSGRSVVRAFERFTVV